MSYTFTITCNTPEEIEQILSALRATDVPVAEAVEGSAGVDTSTSGDPQTAEAPKRRGRPPREKPTETAPESSEGVETDTTDESKVIEKDKKVTLDDARAALRGLQSRIGEDDMATAIAVLKEFGATRISEVKPEQYADFIGACAKAA